MVIVDTNIIIDHLRADSSRETLLIDIIRNTPDDSIHLSTLSLQELYAGKSTLDPSKENSMLLLISKLSCLDYTYEVAKIAGSITRDLDYKITFADAGIAATAIYYNLSLATLNIKDFENIGDLELYKLA